jgi:GH25 family lysozyme M1 (1,4-beta-N-acetylmuramidase)
MSTLRGIDISHYQSVTPSLSGLAFVIARATFGNVPDDRYDLHCAATLKAGLVFGAYHFGRSAQYVSIAAQVSAFLAKAHDARVLILDLEADDYTDSSGHLVHRTPMSTAEAASFISRVKAADPLRRKVGLYHSDSGFPAVGQDFNHVAKWSSTPPSRPWTFWQTGGTGVDHDTFNGDLAALRALAGLEEEAMNIYSTPGRTTATVVAGTPAYDAPGGKVVLKIPDGTARFDVIAQDRATSPTFVLIDGASADPAHYPNGVRSLWVATSSLRNIQPLVTTVTKDASAAELDAATKAGQKAAAAAVRQAADAAAAKFGA